VKKYKKLNSIITKDHKVSMRRILNLFGVTLIKPFEVPLNDLTLTDYGEFEESDED
jgi:hypothetical protein